MRREGKQLWVSTARWLELALLGSYRREVHIDGESEFVFVEQRRFWLWKLRLVLPFRQVAHVSYGFRELPTQWDIRGRVHDSLERFSVHLATHGATPPILVASFRGAGALGDIGTWAMGDSLLDVEGTQEHDSHALVQHLVDILRVGVKPPHPSGPDLA